MKEKLYKKRYMDDDFDASFEKSHLSRNNKLKFHNSHVHEKNSRVIFDTNNFKCLHCGLFVTADREISGVNNRNHCPRCLWSRHMDLLKPGDRKAECKSRMEPVGLTVKQTLKRYNMDKLGELMLIHCCTGCGKLSINRVAADDNALSIYQIFINNSEANPELKMGLETEGILLLGSKDLPDVYTQLFGRQAVEDLHDPIKVE